MKTKALLLVCLFLGIGLTQLSAQFPTTDGTRSLVYTFEFPNISYLVSCDGITGDILFGNLTMKETDLWKDGVLIRGNAHIRGELISQSTNEVFTLRQEVKGWGPLDQNEFFIFDSYHWNIIGDEGTHYLGDISYGPDYFSINRITCPGKNK